VRLIKGHPGGRGKYHEGDYAFFEESVDECVIKRYALWVDWIVFSAKGNDS